MSAASFSPTATKTTSAACPGSCSELKVPVYATEFTLAYVEGKLEEHQLLDDTTLIEITPKAEVSPSAPSPSSPSA